jgi:hypothetical protein
MQMAHSALILSMVIAFILLSSSLVSYFTMSNEIVFASSDEGGDGGGDEGGDGGGEGEGNEEQVEEQSEEPAAGEQEDGSDQQPLPEDQQQQLPEGEQGEDVGQFVLCDESEVFIPATGKCEDEVPQTQGGSEEKCDNSIDDDRDGAVDEGDCVPAEGRQTGASGTIPPTFAPNSLTGQTGGWGLPQGSAQGVDQGQGSGNSDSSGNDGGGSSGTATPPIPSFAPSGAQGSNAPATTQRLGSSPAQETSGGSTTTPIPSFAPSGGNDGSGQGSTTGTTPTTPSGADDQGDQDGDSGSTGRGGAGQGGAPGRGGGSSSMSTNAATSSSTSTGTYTDPNGRFSIGYPPNAIVTPVDEESPGDKVVSFNSPPPSEFTTIGIEVSNTGTPIDLESHVNSYLVALETSLPAFTLAESPDCLRYTLGGEKACAYIYTVGEQSAPDGSSTPVGQSSNSQGSPKAIMELYSVVGNNLYKISYSTLPNDFNGQLPVAEGMIRSFALLNSNVS